MYIFLLIYECQIFKIGKMNFTYVRVCIHTYVHTYVCVWIYVGAIIFELSLVVSFVCTYMHSAQNKGWKLVGHSFKNRRLY